MAPRSSIATKPEAHAMQRLFLLIDKEMPAAPN
jgi:hypothetical protein